MRFVIPFSNAEYEHTYLSYELDDEGRTCLWKLPRYTPFKIVVGFGIITGMCFALSVVWAFRGKEQNEHLAIARALRDEAKARDMTCLGFPPFSLSVSMHFAKPPLFGAGVSLFFNWQLFAILTSAILGGILSLLPLNTDTSFPKTQEVDTCLSFAPAAGRARARGSSHGK